MSNDIKSETAQITHKIPVIDRSEKKLKTIECECHVVEIFALRRSNYLFHCAKNPIPGHPAHAHMIVHVQSGYVLAFGNTEKAALKNAENEVSQLTTISDIGTRIVFQEKLNKLFNKP